MLLLKDLCSGTLKSQHVVIEDGVEVSGRCLVLVLLNALCKKCDQVLLLASNRSPHYYLNALPEECKSKIKVVDYRKLPKLTRPADRLSAASLVTAIHGNVQGCDQRVGVVFDSAARWVFTHSSPTTIPVLVKGLLECRAQGNKVEQVVSVVTRGVHDDHTVQVISSHPATTTVRLHTPVSPHHQLRAVTLHRELHEEPKESTEEFNISSDFLQVVDVVSGKDVEKKMSTSSSTAVTDTETDAMARLTGNLTFNLSLKPEEKTAKDKVILPYTQIFEKQASTGDSRGSTIHYVPDDADDFDDEDPDEDLDF